MKIDGDELIKNIEKLFCNRCDGTMCNDCDIAYVDAIISDMMLREEMRENADSCMRQMQETVT